MELPTNCQYKVTPKIQSTLTNFCCISLLTPRPTSHHCLPYFNCFHFLPLQYYYCYYLFSIYIVQVCHKLYIQSRNLKKNMATKLWAARAASYLKISTFHRAFATGNGVICLFLELPTYHFLYLL